MPYLHAQPDLAQQSPLDSAAMHIALHYTLHNAFMHYNLCIIMQKQNALRTQQRTQHGATLALYHIEMCICALSLVEMSSLWNAVQNTMR